MKIKKEPEIEEEKEQMAAEPEPIYMRTIITGHTTNSLNKEKKPILVLLHGFAGSGTLFFKVFKKLSEHFVLITIDNIGMGGSTRPENFNKGGFGPQESIDYFVNYVEAWRVAMNNLSGFYMAGHSFGGYVVGNYALKYHMHIKKLIMISPVGLRMPPKPLNPL